MSDWSHVPQEDLWLRTVSGKHISVLNPKVEDINIFDIAIGLANECRWGAQAPHHYSVAQHSILVYNIICSKLQTRNRNLMLGALLHDAHEAYLKDIPRPLKTIIAPLYKPIQSTWQRTIETRFSISCNYDEQQIIAEADEVACATEAKWFHDAEGNLSASGWLIDGTADTTWPHTILDPKTAYHLFTGTFKRTVELFGVSEDA